MRKGQAEISVVVVFLLLIGLGVVALLGFDIVDANKMGVKVRLGRITGTMESGMQWTGLFTHVYQYDLKTRKNVIELSGGNSAIDKTGQAVYATINVNYRIKKDAGIVQRLYSEIGTDDVIADRLNIDAIIMEGFKQATVKYEALEIIDKRQDVKELAKENIRNNFPKDFFEIQEIIVTNIDFSDQFKQAIEQKKVAEQNALKEENQLKVVMFQQQQEIERYKAEAEKMKLQREQVTQLLNQQKWIEKWNGQLPQTLLTSGEQAQFLLNIPTGDAR